jgi:hypothetical protein
MQDPLPEQTEELEDGIPKQNILSKTNECEYLHVIEFTPSLRIIFV